VGSSGCSAGAMGSGVSAFQSAAFVLGQSAPHPCVMAGLHGPAQTGRHDLTATADDFGLFGLENRGVAIPDRKEQLRVLVQTGSAISPRHEAEAHPGRHSRHRTVLANRKYPQRVSGHRDAFATVCPGQYLYAKLPEIRAGAAAARMNAKPPTTVAVPVAASRGAFSPGDFTSDRKADILAITRSGDLYLYRGSGLGGFTGGGTKIGAGWGVFTKVFSGGDCTGDAKAHILVIKANGDFDPVPRQRTGRVHRGRHQDRHRLVGFPVGL